MYHDNLLIAVSRQVAPSGFYGKWWRFFADPNNSTPKSPWVLPFLYQDPCQFHQNWTHESISTALQADTACFFCQTTCVCQCRCWLVGWFAVVVLFLLLLFSCWLVVFVIITFFLVCFLFVWVRLFLLSNCLFFFCLCLLVCLLLFVCFICLFALVAEVVIESILEQFFVTLVSSKDESGGLVAIDT